MIALVFFIGIATDQILLYNMQKMLFSPTGTSPWIWGFAILSILNNLFYPLLALLLCLQKFNPSQTFLTLLNQSSKEVLRAWGKSFLWAFALVVPGFLKFLKYSFVPLVVGLNPVYQTGQLDALKESERIGKQHLGKLLGLFMIFSLIIPLALSQFSEERNVIVSMKTALPFAFFEALIYLIYVLSLLRIYDREMRS
ncbi:MAG: hypothetical protein LW875_04800 [Proteobacteria bacterium]|nr:hypothetical protein [Pseudomonadota bacterium]